MISRAVVAARIAAWLLTVAIAILSLVPPGLRPETGMPHNLEHFAIFVAAGFAFGIGYGHRSISVAIGLVVYAGVIELAQKLISGRHARLSDFIVDALAMCIGVTAGAVLVTFYLERDSQK